MAHRQRSVESTAPVDNACVACGRRGLADGDRMLEAAILALLADRPAGEVDILQAGRIVDGSTAKGPIQVRRSSR